MASCILQYWRQNRHHSTVFLLVTLLYCLACEKSREISDFAAILHTTTTSMCAVGQVEQMLYCGDGGLVGLRPHLGSQTFILGGIS